MSMSNETEEELFFSSYKKRLIRRSSTASSFDLVDSPPKEINDYICQCCREPYSSSCNDNHHSHQNSETIYDNLFGASLLLYYQRTLSNLIDNKRTPSTLLWKFLQKKFNYNFRSFSTMTEAVLNTYSQLVSVFELNWSVLEPLTVHAMVSHCEFGHRPKYDHGRRTKLCRCKFPICHTAPSPTTENVLKKTPLSYSSEKYLLSPEDSSAWASISNDSPSLPSSQLDGNSSSFCHYCIYPFAVQSHHCVIDFPENMAEASKDICERELGGNHSTKDSFPDLMTFESKIQKNLNNAAGRSSLGSDCQSSEEKGSFNEFRRQGQNRNRGNENTDFTRLLTSQYVLTQVNQIGLSGCHYPSNLFVIFLRLPHLMRHYMAQDVSHRRPLPLSLALRLLKKETIVVHDAAGIQDGSVSKNRVLKDKRKTILGDEKECVNDQRFLRIIRWKKSRCPLLVLSRLLSPHDIKKKICLFVFFSGKDMIAFDWLPFLGRFFNFVVNCQDLKVHQQQSIRKERVFCIPLLEESKDKERNRKNQMKVSTRYYESECQLHFASVLIEYPGCGQSSSPPMMDLVLNAAVQGIGQAIADLSQRLGVSSVDIRLIGYSLGTAVALRIAHSLSLDIIGDKDHPHSIVQTVAFQALSQPPQLILTRVILLAPLTSIFDWTTTFLKLPNIFQLAAKLVINPLLSLAGIPWDNTTFMRKLCETLYANVDKFSSLKICIVHGAEDTVVPSSMGESLALLAREILEVFSLHPIIKDSYGDKTGHLKREDDVSAITAQEEMLPCSSWSRSESWCWTQGVTVQFYKVDGDHHTIMTDEKIQKIIYNCMFSRQYATKTL